MNPGTGQIVTELELDAFGLEERKNFQPVKEKEMTAKQKKTKQVSKFDNRSMLGKRCASYRKNRYRK